MKDILQQVDRNDGIAVPDGYFDDFATRMAASLPRREWEEEAATGKPRVMPRSWWQRVRPYVYLAAMFMGVWCMMKMFDMMRPSSQGLSFDSNPVIAAAVGNDYFVDDYMISQGNVNDYELLEDLYETGFTPAAYDTSTNGDDSIYYQDL